MDAVESWNGFDVPPRESCDVFRILSIVIMLIEACNIIVIMIIYFDHYMACQNQELLSAKVKIGVAVSWGISGSLITWWYCCGSQEFLSRMAVRVMCVVSVVSPAAFRNNNDGVSECINTEASKKHLL